MNNTPPAFNTRGKTKIATMATNDPNAIASVQEDASFIDLSDRFEGTKSSGDKTVGNREEDGAKSATPTAGSKTGAMPKQNTGTKVTQSVLLRPPTLSFPRPPPFHNFSNQATAQLPKTNQIRDEIAPMIKEMMGEAKEVLLGEMRTNMQEIMNSLRNSNGEMGAGGRENRARVPYKRRRHNISSESMESRRSIPRNELVSENVNSNGNSNVIRDVNRNTRNPMRPSVGPLPAFTAQLHQRQSQAAQQARHNAYSESVPIENQVRNSGVRSELNIEKWGISFQGFRDSMTIEDFLFRLEYLKEKYGCSWGDILRDFHRLLGGEAREWYWLYIRTNRNVDWPTLQFALQRQFASQLTDFELMREINERKQKPGESIDEYFHAIGILRSRLRNQIPEYEMVRLVKGNLRESLAKLVYPIAVYSVEQLRMECKEVERCFPRRDRVQQSGFAPRSYQVHEITPIQTDEQESPRDEGQVPVEEVRYQRVTKHPPSRDQSSRKNTCWNCGLEGHLFTDCMSLHRRIFCFKCGKPEVITPKCSVCNPTGNAHRNAMTAGVSRSTQCPQEQMRQPAQL